MKVEQKKEFTPVVIILESQEEIDTVYAVCNYTNINEAIDLTGALRERLSPYKSSGYTKFHNALCKALT